MKSVKLLFLAGCLAAMSGCQTAPEPAYIGDPVKGRQAVENLCADCHAIDPGAASPRVAAPPFDRVLARYGEEHLTQDLRDSIEISHRFMPTFHLGDGGAENIVAYLKGIQTPEPRK
jgi:mono/diheme cytochrome c family protein